MSELRLQQRSQVLVQDNGHNDWETRLLEWVVPSEKTAIIICDMWDSHWSRGARERVNAMAHRMNAVVAAARAKGVQIIHAPSDTMALYAGTPARERVVQALRVVPPAPLEHLDPALPIDDSDGGSDTGEAPWYRAWTRQHPAIEIDQERDAISDDGIEVYSFMRQEGIDHVLIMGVHTNMCVLRRSFAIKAMVRWGMDVALVRDLTDAMYNPARSPYVSHDDGTRLVVGYIEKFWCPTVLSDDLL